MKKSPSESPWSSFALSGPLFLLLLLLFAANKLLNSPTSVHARPKQPVTAAAQIETGVASYYGSKYQGRPTASGEIFNMNRMTAAHRTYAFGTRVKVTNLANQRSVIVRINDRGPFVDGRIIDLSLAAAKELQMVEGGLAEVRVEVVR